MDINKFFDIENYYKQKIREEEQKIREEEKLLREAYSKYDALIARAYQEGVFKFTLGKLKETLANYNKIPISQINLSLKGSAELFFDLDFKNYRGIVSAIKRYPSRFVKVVASFTSQKNNLKVSLSPFDICDFLMENEKLFSTGGDINNNLQITNGFAEDGGVCVLRTKISFAPECIEKVSINIHPKQLDKDINSEILKSAHVNNLEREQKIRNN